MYKGVFHFQKTRSQNKFGATPSITAFPGKSAPSFPPFCSPSFNMFPFGVHTVTAECRRITIIKQIQLADGI